jgi:hypothetical protein
MGSCSAGLSNHSSECKAEIGCSDVAMRYFSLSSPEPSIYQKKPISSSPYLSQTGLAKTHLVERLVKLLKLSRLGHDRLVHEEWRLNLLESFGPEEVESVCNHRLVEVDAVARKEEAAMSSDLGPCGASLPVSVSYRALGRE